MDAFEQNTLFSNIFFEGKDCHFNSLESIPKGLGDNKGALAQVEAWRQTGTKPPQGQKVSLLIDTSITRPQCDSIQYELNGKQCFMISIVSVIL